MFQISSVTRKVKNPRSLGIAVIAMSAIIILAGCHFDFGGSKTYASFSDLTIPAGFEFATARAVTFNLTVTYNGDSGLKNYDGTVSIVTQDETGDSILGSGLIVNGTGSFSVAIPTSVTHVVIRPDKLILVGAEADLEPGTTSITKVLAPSSDKAVVTSAKDLFSSSAARAAISFGTTKTGFRTLATSFDSNGVPTGTGGLESARVAYKESFLTDIGLSFPEYQRVPTARPDYIKNGVLSSVVIKEDAEVAVTFLSEGAGYKNSLGYFVRKTGEALTKPSTSEIVIIFPNSSAAYSGGGLNGGDTIKLRNPIVSDTTNYATTKFTAGYTIHWVLVSDGYRSGTVSSDATRYYSVPELNPEYSGTASSSAHSALLFYTESPYSDYNSSTETTEDDAKLVLGFEDMGRKTGDEDFNDCLFVVTATPFKNIDTENLPKPKKDDPDTEITESFPAKVNGTMVYEDLWPSKGDYDFNDMAVEFRMQTIRTGKGYANKYKGDFVLTAAGANLKSGLGFVLPVKPEYIESVKYTAGQAYNGTVFVLNSRNFESHGSSYSVIPVIGSAVGLFGSNIVNTKMDQPTLSSIKINIEVTFTKNAVLASDITGKTPDIFLVSSEDRTKEIHVIGKTPTSKASGRFDTMDDASVLPGGPYYKDKSGAPWALMIPAPFSHTVEQTELPAGYLHFGDWVVSGGLKYTDWYDSSLSGYTDASKLYVAH